MFHSPLKVLSIGNFRFLTIANVFSMGGFWIQQITIGWLMYSITRSALLTTLVLSIDALPPFVAGPIGGVIADLWDRRRLMMLNLIFQCGVILALSALVVFDAFQVWHLFVFVLLMGTTWIVIEPARTAMVSTIVPKDQFYNGYAIFEMSYSLPRIVIPLLGGVVISWIGAEGALIVQAMLVGLAAYGVYKINHSVVRGGNFRNIYSELTISINIVRDNPVIRYLYILVGVHLLFFVPFVPSLFPVYTVEAFGGGPIALGVMSAILGLGSFGGGILMAMLDHKFRRGRILVVCTVITAVGIMLMSVSPNLWIGYCFVFITGVVSGIVFICYITLLQSSVPRNRRARVMGVGMILWGLVPLGGWASGAIADSIGPQGSMMVGAFGMIVAIAIAHRYMIKVWNIRNPQIES